MAKSIKGKKYEYRIVTCAPHYSYKYEVGKTTNNKLLRFLHLQEWEIVGYFDSIEESLSKIKKNIATENFIPEQVDF